MKRPVLNLDEHGRLVEQDWGYYEEIACENCGETERLDELHLPESTMLCLVCETRFPVKNPLGRV